MKKNITFALILVNVGLAFVLAWQWFSPAGRRDTQWVAPAPIKPQLNGGFLPPVRGGVASSGLAAMEERPIFSATRRPLSAASAPVVARVDPLDSVRLYGVFSGSEGGGVIVGTEGKTRRMKVSEALGEWRLQKVRDKEVVFARGMETRVISLIQVRQGQTARPAGSFPLERSQPSPPLSNAAPLAGGPQLPAVVQPLPATAPSSRPAASSAKQAPGFLIGGSR